MNVIKECEICGKPFKMRPFEIKLGKKKYCSMECRNIAYKKPRIPRIIITCKWCGKDFEIVSSLLKTRNIGYCSQYCCGKAMGKQNGKNLKRTPIRVERVCQECGNIFFVKPCVVAEGKGKFCSKSCASKNRTRDKLGINSPYWKPKTKFICKVCGEEFEVDPSQTKYRNIQYCSKKCMGIGSSKSRIGENAPSWKGGVSFEPYCPKFNTSFKNRVRDFFGNRCVVCGKTPEENGRALSVHNVNYDKMVCCNDVKPLFVAVCISHNSIANGNCEQWEKYFTDIINNKYGGKCYNDS